MVGRSGIGEEPREHHDRAGDIEPVGEHGGPGRRDIWGTDLQRHQVQPHPDRERRHHHVDHQRAVDGEELVVPVVGQHVQLRLSQLGADGQRQSAGYHHHHQRRTQGQQPDPLVVGAGQPADDRARLAAGAGSGLNGRRSVRGRGHAPITFLPRRCAGTAGTAPGRPPGRRSSWSRGGSRRTPSSAPATGPRAGKPAAAC